MYVLVDLARMVMVYRCEKVETLRALTNIELAHTRIAILEESSVAAYGRFTLAQLEELFGGLTGGLRSHSHSRSYVESQIVRLCQTAPVAAVDAFEVVVQSLQIKPQDKDYYRYAKGKPRAEMLEEAYNPPPLAGDWTAAQALTAGVAPVQAPAPAQPAQTWVTAQTTAPPKYAPPWA